MSLRSIDLNRIGDFLRIVELGNISRAAEVLGERKSKLSRSLALLEQELGVQLVYRTTRQFQLTDAGRLLYGRAKAQFGGLEELIGGLMNQEDELRGRIKITAANEMGPIVVTPMIHEFLRIHPRVEFEIVYSDEILDLVKLGIDIALRVGKMRDSGLIQKRVGLSELIVAAAPKYLDMQKTISHPEDLQDHRIVDYRTPGKAVWQLYAKSGRRSVPVEPTLTSNNYMSVRDLAILGHGVAFLPRFLCGEALNSGELVHVLRNWRGEDDPVHVVMPHQKKVARKNRVFFDFLAQKLPELFSAP